MGVGAVRDCSTRLHTMKKRRGAHDWSRILVVSEIFPPTIGGSGVMMHGIYSRVRNADVTVLADGGGPGLATRSVEDGMTVLRQAIATRNWGVLTVAGIRQRVQLAWAIHRLLKRRDGIVHCARALPEGVAAMIARWFGGPPYICWTHGEDLVSALASREFTQLTRAVFRGAEAAIASSRNTAAMLDRFQVPSDKRHVVYPAVDASRFHPAVDGSAVRGRYASPDDVLLLSVGRLQRRKGHDVAIQAVAVLRDALPHLRYVIVGDGEERERLERLTDEHQIRDRVFFAESVGDADLPAYYAASDIFLLPNRIDNGDIEGFGIVFLEASAAGKPTIGGRSGGVPEAVEHGVTGVLVDGANVHEVADAIRTLARAPAVRREMGIAGRARVIDRFTWARAAQSMEELQDRLIADR